jgi:hypothetical protein
MKKLALGMAALALLVCGTMAVAGPVGGGPRTWNGQVEAYSSRYITEYFVGGQRASVGIVGDGATDVDIYVRDENGNLIARGIGPTDIEFVTFTPRWTGRFTIEVRNLGGTWNYVRLVTN